MGVLVQTGKGHDLLTETEELIMHRSIEILCGSEPQRLYDQT